MYVRCICMLEVSYYVLYGACCIGKRGEGGEKYSKKKCDYSADMHTSRCICFSPQVYH